MILLLLFTQFLVHAVHPVFMILLLLFTQFLVHAVLLFVVVHRVHFVLLFSHRIALLFVLRLIMLHQDPLHHVVRLLQGLCLVACKCLPLKGGHSASMSVNGLTKRLVFVVLIAAAVALFMVVVLVVVHMPMMVAMLLPPMVVVAMRTLVLTMMATRMGFLRVRLL